MKLYHNVSDLVPSVLLLIVGLQLLTLRVDAAKDKTSDQSVESSKSLDQHVINDSQTESVSELKQLNSQSKSSIKAEMEPGDVVNGGSNIPIVALLSVVCVVGLSILAFVVYRRRSNPRGPRILEFDSLNESDDQEVVIFDSLQTAKLGINSKPANHGALESRYI